MERREGRILKSQFPDVDVPEMSVNDFLEQHSWLNKPQDSIAVIGRSVGPPDASKEWRLSYRELRESVRRVASGLARRGLRKGDVVFVCSSNCPEYVITMLAVYSLGAVLTSAIPGSSVNEILYKLGIAMFCGTLKFFVVSSDELTTARKLVERCGVNVARISFGSIVDKECIPFNDLLEDSGDAFPKDNCVESGDLAVVLYSSGTTGPPKGIPWAHKILVSHMAMPRFTMREGDVFLLSPLSNVPEVPMSALSLGVTSLALPCFSDPEHYSIAINKYKVTYLFCIPPLIVSLVKKGYELPTLQRCDAAGSTCSPAVIREARITHPHLVITGIYGMNEIGVLINPSSETEQSGNKRGVLIGKPVAKSQAKVSPSEMEDILMSHLGVGDVSVTGVPDPENEGYELIRAFVVRKTDAVSAEDLIEFVKDKTPRKYVTLTGGVRFLKSIPKNRVGKNMRSELQAQPFE
ncbi:PREDICTED: 4-coumarate--CoA ligase 3-like isoform X2 [Priapulus caudatus]|uniref:4-coumarate--CoA ligase 3-like isoform X2 n=1 Tax=Priapulus caudatus TaxID=37621 RepID=A0ABM1DSB5_PRICU|nr:PREDICTED: 4-coumarate--CoA ligase 3-like isoform X2 [Priapulus caudatus]